SFFFQAEDGIRYRNVTGVQTCALPISLKRVEDFRKFADHVRALSGGIPIGFKISAQHIEDDIAFAVDASADYIILDGRGGGTGRSEERRVVKECRTRQGGSERS